MSDSCVPGSVDVPGREFFYFQSSPDEDFHQFTDDVFDSTPEIAVPTSGGAIEEKVRINLADGTSLAGLSYKGDIEGWRSKFIAFCNKAGRTWGIAQEGRLRLSTGEVLSINELGYTCQD